ncbi:MAG: coproporphyrinogen dehydrogenase HemZ [Lachnospiraceae bacterium]|nr:coproporphyrinogen dehydrogenase HemZ [Lachnospiraceae bacterium]
MFKVYLSCKDYEYDVRSMIQAFFGNLKIEADYVDNSADYNLYAQTSCSNIELRLCYDNMADSSDKEVSINETDELLYKAAYKNVLKKELYNMFSKALGKTLPWGTLTGIRPSKIALTRIEQGISKEDIIEFMKDTYLCSLERAELACDIALKEYGILKDIDYKNGYSLYVGIPFCPTRCLYCSFTSYPADSYKDYVEPYLGALFKEIEQTSKLFKNKTLTSVYIGGGTPTTLSAGQLKSLIDKLKECFDFSTVREFTVEAGRPDSITMDKLKVLKECKVDRISINPQTMCQSTLDIIGRKHTVSDIYDACNMAEEAGHKVINMDLIVGLPGEDTEVLKDTLEKIVKLDPANVTVHTLAMKRTSNLTMNIDKYKDMLSEHVSDAVEYAKNYLCEYGYEPYYLYRQKNMTDNLENIGYSKVGKEGIYNILIMEEIQNILALGAGAVCKFVDYKNKTITRVDNVKSINDYITRIDDMIEKKSNFLLKEGANYDEIFW